jgi:hypothetical protein
MCYFGVNTSSKGTMASPSCNTDEFLLKYDSGESYCCPLSIGASGTEVRVYSNSSGHYCVPVDLFVVDEGQLYCREEYSNGQNCKSGWTLISENANEDGEVIRVCTAPLGVCGAEGRKLPDAVQQQEEVEISYSFNGTKTDTVPWLKGEEYPIEQPRSGLVQKYFGQNCTFQNWNTKSDGTGVSYKTGDKYIANANLDLHAVVSCNNGNNEEFELTYYYNGTRTDVVPIYKGEDYIIESPKTSLFESYIGKNCTFKNWIVYINNTKSGVAKSGDVLSPTNNYELHADFSCVINVIADAGPGGYISEVTGNNNLPSNSQTYSQTCALDFYNSVCKVAGEVTAERDGYKFTGWGYKAGCEKGSLISTHFVSADTTLHACYTEKSKPEEPKDPNPDNQEPNVDENPPTGQIALFVVWVIGLVSIVYSVWYFKKIKQN